MAQKVHCLALSALLLVLSFPVDAQQPKKVPRIGLLIGGSPSTSRPNADAFRQGLRDLGYVEGKSILIEYRYAEGKFERLVDLAAELVRLNVDVIVTGGSNPARAAKNASSTIPIVMASSSDAVALGLVSNLARPGGNLTGLTRMERDLIGKRVELSKETFPRAARMVVLWHPGTGTQLNLKEYEAAGQALGMTFHSLQVQSPNEFDHAFSSAKRMHADVMMIDSNGFTNSHRKPIVELAAKNRLATMCETRLFVEACGLMSYSPYTPDLHRRAAYFVDKIIKGAKPADLPVEQPTKFELVINLKTAKQIGLTIPQSVLYRADKVIK